MDIVGFEHKAKTKKQKATVEKAEEQLEAAEALFQLPAAAGCVLEASRVTLEGEDHGHDHGAKHHGGKDHGPKEGTKGDGKGGTKGGHSDDEHSAFRAEYAFECKAPASLTSIGFGYFKVFAGAQKLDVTVVTPKQQNRFEVSRAKPRVDLGGMATTFSREVDDAIWTEIGREEAAIRADPAATRDPVLIGAFGAGNAF